MQRERRIYMKHGMTSEIATHFGVSPQTVRNALRCASDSELAGKIRTEALIRGGFFADYPNQESI